MQLAGAAIGVKGSVPPCERGQQLRRHCRSWCRHDQPFATGCVLRRFDRNAHSQRRVHVAPHADQFDLKAWTRGSLVDSATSFAV